MKTFTSQDDKVKNENIDEADSIDLELDDELDYEDPADYLEASYRFIQDDIQLIVRVYKNTGLQSLILRLINLKTKKAILEKKQNCIHVAIMNDENKQPHQKLLNTSQEKMIDQDILMIKTTEKLKNLNLSIEDRFFALKSWAECIAESDIGSIYFQGEIDRFTNLQYPISHFIMFFLSEVNLDYIPKYIDYIEKMCVFEGKKHEPSIRANTLFLLKVLEQSDYLKNTKDSVKLKKITEIIQRLGKLDKATLLLTTNIWIQKKIAIEHLKQVYK